MKKLTILFLISLITLFLSSCTEKYLEKELSLLYFGTSINVKLYYHKGDDIESAVSYIRKTYQNYDKVTNRYTDYANTKGVFYLNEHSGMEVEVDPKLIEVMEYAIDKSMLIKQDDIPVFNIAVGNASNIYHDIFDSYLGEEIDSSIFPSSDILNTSYPIDVSKITIKREESKVFITESMSIDLGGIAKGYATNIISSYLNAIGIDYTIDAGSSSIITSIGNPYKKNNEFKIGLKHPDSTIDSSHAFSSIILSPGLSISTSGDYQKYFTYEGKRYSHILNPSNNLPYDTDIRSIAVIAKDMALGDILSTSLYIIGYDKAVEYIEQADDIDAIIYKSDGTIYVSKGVNGYQAK